MPLSVEMMLALGLEPGPLGRSPPDATPPGTGGRELLSTEDGYEADNDVLPLLGSVREWPAPPPVGNTGTAGMSNLVGTDGELPPT